MTFVRTYGGAVQVLRAVAAGKASRDWVRVIRYAITSPTRIASLKWTAQERRNLQSMIDALHGKRIRNQSPAPRKKK